MVTLLIATLIAFLTGAAVMYGIHKVHEHNERMKSTLWQFKQKLDEFEQEIGRTRDELPERRNSYAQNDDLEDAAAIVHRVIRDVDDFGNYIHRVNTWRELLTGELNRAVDIITNERASGTKNQTQRGTGQKGN